MEGVESVKFVGVLLDEHLFWKDHIKYVENKVAKIWFIIYIKTNSRYKLVTCTILFLHSRIFKLLCKSIVGQYRQNKYQKASELTKSCNTN